MTLVQGIYLSVYPDSNSRYYLFIIVFIFVDCARSIEITSKSADIRDVLGKTKEFLLFGVYLIKLTQYFTLN